MGLNVELVSQFAKLTANKKETKKESTAWGEVVEITDSGKCFVKLDGSDRVTPVEMTTEAKPGDRVSVTIRNHAATLTGNTSSPSINADGSTVQSIRTDFKNLSADNLLIRGDLTASTGRIDSLVAKDVEIENTLAANVGKFAELETDIADINRLNADFVTTGQLSAKEAEIRSLFVDYATIENLNAKDAEIRNLFADYATVESLKATNAAVGNLTADVGDINTLIFGSASGDTIHANFANAVISTLGEAWIGDAMIDNVSADKITAGDIITDNVKVKSNDGKLLIADQTIQISDNSKVRVQIGKDASNDYSINIWDANGKLMFSEGGLTEDAVKEQIIRNDMVKDDANISASKLDIDTLFGVINDDGSHTLKSSKVKLDENNQTLDVAFGALTTKVDDISVGGRNLIAGTSLGTVYSGIVAADSTLGYKDVWSAKTIDNADSTEYIVSFDAKADEETDIRCFFYMPNTTLTSESSTGNRRGDDGTVITDGVSIVHITTEWKRYWVKWTQTPANDKKSVIVGRHSSTTSNVYIRAVKLEVGNKATDWTPAPEDIDGEFDSVNSKYSSLSISIDGLNSTVAAQGQAMGTLSTQYSTLQSDLNGFKTTVGATYTTNCGRNLLLNTGGGEPVVLNGGATVKTSGIQSSTNVDGIQTLNCSTTGNEVYYRFMTPTQSSLWGLIPGETYILSGKAKVSTTSGILEYLSTRTQYTVGVGWTGGAANVILREDSDEWVSFETKFTVESNATGYYASLQLYFTGSWEGTIQLTELKLEKGTKATDWTPAPEDMLSNAKAESIYATHAELAVEADRIGMRVDTISLTGRNLIADTSQDVIELGGYPSSGTSEGKMGRTIIAPTGNEYVLSFDAKSTVDGDIIQCHFYNPNTTTGVLTSTGYESEAVDGTARLPLTTEWKRYWIKYTQNGAATTTQKSWIIGRRLAGLGTGTVSIRAIKLEAGSQPTLWTAAPDDNEAYVSSQIEAFADNISLSVTDGSIGSEASIKLSVNGEITTQKIDMTDVRTAFANDTSAIDISAGTITFNSGTLIVNSENFILDKDGNLEATSAKLDKAEITNATITGTIDNRDADGDGVYMRGGYINLLYMHDATGRISSRYLSYSTTTYGLCLWLPAMGMTSGKDSVFLWGHDEYNEDGTISHICDYSMEGFSLEEDVNDPNTFRHHFNTSAYFLDRVHFGSTSYFHTSYFLNQNALGWYESDGSQTQLLIVGSDDIFKVGHTSLDTTLQGDIITVTAKDKIELKNGVETIRFYGASTTTGTNTGYIHSTNAGKCALGIAAYPWYRVYATNTSIGTSDRRLKENIIGLTDIHSKLFDKLQPVEYNFIDGDGRTNFGLIAQDVIFAMNELGLDEDKLDLVHHDMNVNNETGELNDTYGIAYTNLIAMLIHEVQKLKQEITILKGE